MRFLAGTSMLAIVVIMIVQVFARYVLNASLIWAEELCRYILDLAELPADRHRLSSG